MTDRSDNFLQGPLAGKLFRFAVPVAFTIICEQLVNGTDVLVLGQFVGPEAMAVVGNDMPVLTLLISLLKYMASPTLDMKKVLAYFKE
ncbi:hypothetical protein [Mitsuokella jalaludinii]|uniref:hypothetical protein n=1 Tax=Mitsuokella jalaludinii TaxID=187979 RepID=UPI0020D106D6|nr:hypothetical protein [Mitsuokella jalaludinii]MCQ1533013.1 hypothetical protein [Mitsuokella jalaludinii]MEE0480862.1 hypothetical protein [Mitsuokella jalaludinii]